MKTRIIAIIICILLASFATAAAGEQSQNTNTDNANVSYSERLKAPAYLVVMSTTTTGNSQFTYIYHKVSDLLTCYDMVENSRVDIAQGGDTEAAVAMYCVIKKGKIVTEWQTMP